MLDSTDVELKKEEDKVKGEYTKTDIMNRYLKQHPKYKKQPKAHKASPGSEYDLAVYDVILDNGQKLLLKAYKVGVKSKKIKSFLREYHILRNIQAMNTQIIKILDMKYVLDESKENFIFEMLYENNGIVFDYDNYCDYLKPSSCVSLAYQLTCILCDLEKVGISHMNIKPGSLFLDSNNRLLLGNFGSAISFFYNRDQITNFIGYFHSRVYGLTKFYKPPELYMYPNAELPITLIPQKYDCFSYIMTWYMWINWEYKQKVGSFQRSNKTDYEKFIRKVKNDLEKYNLNSFRDVFNSCFNTDFKSRPTFDTIRERFERDTNLRNPKPNYSASQLRKQIDDNRKNKEYEAMIWKLKDLLESGQSRDITDSINLIHGYLKVGEYKNCIEEHKRNVALSKSENDENFPVFMSVIKAYLMLDDYKYAENLLTGKWSKKVKMTSDYLRMEGKLYEAKGKYQLALDKYEKAFELYKNEDKSLNGIKRDIAKALLKLGHIKIAEEYLPANKSWSTLFLRGMVEKLKKNYDLAMELFKSAEYDFKMIFGEDHPLLIDILTEISETYGLLGKTNSGHFILDEAESLAKSRYGESHYKYSMIYLYHAKLYYSSFELGNARKMVSKAIEELNETHSAEAYFVLGNCYRMKYAFDDSIKVLKDAVRYHEEDDTLSIEIKLSLAETLIENEEISEALKYLGKVERWCFKIGEEANSYLSRAYALTVKGSLVRDDYKLAVKTINHLMKFKEGKADVEIALGEVFDKFCMPELSYIHFTKARELYKNYLHDKLHEIELLKMIGDAHRALGEYENANNCYETGLSMINCAECNLAADLFAAMCECAALSGNIKLAVECDNKALNIYRELENYQGVVITKIYVAEICCSLKKYGNAMKNLEDAKRDANSDKRVLARIYSDIGMVLYKQNNIAKALENYMSAKNIMKNGDINSYAKEEYATINTNIGKLQFLNKDYKEAISNFEEALKYSISEPTLKETCELLAKCYNILKDKENEEKYSGSCKILSKKKKERELMEAHITLLIGAHSINLTTKNAIKMLKYAEQKLGRSELKKLYELLIFAYTKNGNKAMIEEYKNKL